MSSLQCLDDLPDDFDDSFLAAPEEICDPFHIRPSISSAEADDLDSLRSCSARAVFTRSFRLAPVGRFQSKARDTLRTDQLLHVQTQTTSFSEALLAWRGQISMPNAKVTRVCGENF